MVRRPRKLKYEIYVNNINIIKYNTLKELIFAGIIFRASVALIYLFNQILDISRELIFANDYF